MPLEWKKRVWLVAAIISAALLLRAAGPVSGGDTSALPMFGLTFIAFAATSVMAVYYRGRSTDHDARQHEILDTERYNHEVNHDGKE